MQTKLTIGERMKDLRVEKGLTLEALGQQTGLSRSALGNYESGNFKDISPFAITTLAQFYGVSTDYLLGVTELKNHPNAELHELHLSDAMLELLKSGMINNRLLCEMALHKDFRRLMVDIEVYVDRIASMRIKDLNTAWRSPGHSSRPSATAMKTRWICAPSKALSSTRTSTSATPSTTI